jgi:hypothetical protein
LCWLCNWPLGWSSSTQINKELITTTTTTTTTPTTTSSSTSSLLHAYAGQIGYFVAVEGLRIYMITIIKLNMTPCCLVHLPFHINLHIHRRQYLKCDFRNLYILVTILVYFNLRLIIQV